jgi:diacylglycerol kinase family enzyme
MKTFYRPVIGYIPSGTCNDFAKNLPLSTDFYQACKIINNNKTVSYDLGRFNDQYFMYVASFGSISSVSYNTDQQSKNFLGYAAYAAYALSMLPEILSAKCHLKVETDEETFEGDYLFGAIANSLSVAGVKINTMSYEDLMDGVFELLLVKCPEHIQDVGTIALALLNSEFDNPYLEFRKIKRARIWTTSNTEWTLDGEYGGNPEEITFEIREKAIDIAVDTTKVK